MNDSGLLVMSLASAQIFVPCDFGGFTNFKLSSNYIVAQLRR